MMKIFILFVSLFIILESSLFSIDIAVIVNAKNPNDTLTKEEIKKLFLGDLESFSGGSFAKPVEQRGEIKREFHSKVTQKTVEELNKYWAKMVFIGKSGKPEEFVNDQDVIKWISDNVEGIGYIKSNAVITNNVKIVYTVK